jgi:hypothetical protein
VDDARSWLDQQVVLSMLSAGFAVVALGLSCAGLNLAVGLGTAAGVLGELIRCCYDLFRGDLLAKLGWPMPATLAGERALWDVLGQQLYRRGTTQAGDALLAAPRTPPAAPPRGTA